MATWSNRYIRVNQYSRPALKLNAVRKIVIHYTANHGAGADNHFTYFDSTIINLKRYASAHIMVDKIKALCIIPLTEIAYHANDGKYKDIPELRPNANFLSIGVEMCQEKDGSFHPNTISRTEDVVAELCRMYKLDPVKDVVRHFDVTRKQCPAPWVSNGKLFTDFKNRVSKKMGNLSTSTSQPSSNNNSILKKGSTGTHVKDLQERLNSIGYDCGNPDGVFGNATDSAVKDFQRDQKLTVDGIVGQQTLDAISKEEKIMKNMIEKLQKQVEALEKKVNNSDPNPSDWAKDVWEKKSKIEKYYDGSNPKGFITREQDAMVIDRLTTNIKKFITNPLNERVEKLEEELKELKEVK